MENILVLGVLACSPLSTGYRITYFDCQNPKDLNQYNFLEYCSMNEDMEAEQKTLYSEGKMYRPVATAAKLSGVPSQFTVVCFHTMS